MSSELGLGTVGIHVAVADSAVARYEEAARNGGLSVVRLDLSAVRSRDQLCDRLAKVFLFPHESRGLDSALDLLSDLSWFGNENGYLVVVDGADSVSAQVVADLAGILPAVADRWRSQRVAFVVLWVGSAHRVVALESLRVANDSLRVAGELAWVEDTYEVEIVDHQVHV